MDSPAGILPTRAADCPAPAPVSRRALRTTLRERIFPERRFGALILLYVIVNAMIGIPYVTL